MAMSVSTGSRSSNSARIVDQPSTTRKTSPYGSQEPSGRRYAPRRSSRRRPRRNGARGRPGASRPRRRCAGPCRWPAGPTTVPDVRQVRAARRANRRRSPGSSRSPRAGVWVRASARDQRAHSGRLAGLRSADDRDMPGGRVQRQPQRVAALLERPVRSRRPAPVARRAAPASAVASPRSGYRRDRAESARPAARGCATAAAARPDGPVRRRRAAGRRSRRAGSPASPPVRYRLVRLVAARPAGGRLATGWLGATVRCGRRW